MNLTSIPALQDNYIWTLNDEAGSCLIVDPGEALPVIERVEANGWQPRVILLTHHHNDHTGGVAELVQRFPDIVVYGPEETRQKGATQIVQDGDNVTFCELNFRVISTPGHTLGHISYYSSPYLFCGDTLFSAGCGRLFEGTAEQMYDSFQKLNDLPGETLVCCAHEYTLSNLNFARAVMPYNSEISAEYLKIKELRAKNGISLPAKLAHERKINLFLRTQDIDLKRALGTELSDEPVWHTFAVLRDKKDRY